ncbi:MAG: hypothetical protein ACLRQF_01930 [Thomasclavelia ramosa]
MGQRSCNETYQKQVKKSKIIDTVEQGGTISEEDLKGLETKELHYEALLFNKITYATTNQYDIIKGVR